VRLVRIEELTVETAEKYREQIAQFYFENIRSCAFLNHFTSEDAYKKIGDFIEHLKDRTAISYGAFDDEKIVGFIWSYVHQFREEKRMYVNEIRVKEAYRGRGIGKELLRLVENKAKEMGLGAVYLHAEAGNIDARKLYEACGYLEERIQMRKEISSRTY
jgi:ribosomal protein S18 acetylase RimI-like enzyme